MPWLFFNFPALVNIKYTWFSIELRFGDADNFHYKGYGREQFVAEIPQQEEFDILPYVSVVYPELVSDFGAE